MPKYANAFDVLPEKLVQEIHKHYCGGNLWIPPAKRISACVKDEILNYREQGYATKVIADMVKRSPRRVCQVIQQHHLKQEVQKRVSTQVLQKAVAEEVSHWKPGKSPATIAELDQSVQAEYQKKFGEAMSMFKGR